MICSHYEVIAYDINEKVLATVTVWSFDEAYFFIDELRERYRKAVKFAIKYPDDEVAKEFAKMEGEQ